MEVRGQISTSDEDNDDDVSVSEDEDAAITPDELSGSETEKEQAAEILDAAPKAKRASRQRSRSRRPDRSRSRSYDRKDKRSLAKGDKALRSMRNYKMRKGIIDPKMTDQEMIEFFEQESDGESPVRFNRDKRRNVSPDIDRRREDRRGKHRHNKTIRGGIQVQSPSEITIYKRAVPCDTSHVSKQLKKISTSSSESVEDPDTSDEVIDNTLHNDFDHLNLIAGRSRDRKSHRRRSKLRSHSRRRSHSRSSKRRRTGRSRTRTCSPDDRYRQRYDDNVHRSRSRSISVTEERQADDAIRTAEKNKAKMFETPGKFAEFDQSYMHDVLVDEKILLVAAHVDHNTKIKIQNFEYVDLAKLLPRDRIMEEEDNRLTWANKGGGRPG